MYHHSRESHADVSASDINTVVTAAAAAAVSASHIHEKSAAAAVSASHIHEKSATAAVSASHIHEKSAAAAAQSSLQLVLLPVKNHRCIQMFPKRQHERSNQIVTRQSTSCYTTL